MVAGRLVRDLMRLCLLLSRTYVPYSKWLGSTFARLPVAADLTPSLRGALAARGYADRERHLCDAYEKVAALHNASGVTDPIDPTRRRYHSRPFLVLHAERFARAVREHRGGKCSCFATQHPPGGPESSSFPGPFKSTTVRRGP